MASAKMMRLATSWHKRIEAAREARAPYMKNWLSHKRAMEGSRFSDGTHKDLPTIQLLEMPSAWIEVILPHILPPAIEYRARQRRPGRAYYAGARILADILNGIMPRMNLDGEALDCVLAAFHSCGVYKIGFDGPAAPPQKRQASADPEQQVTTDPMLERREGRESVAETLPYGRNVPASQIYADPSASRPWRGRWLVHEYWRSIEQLRADPDFDAKGLVEEQGIGEPPNAFMNETGADAAADLMGADPLRTYVQIFEIYDRDSDLILWKTGIGGPEDGLFVRAGRMSELGLDGFPFIFLGYEWHQGHVWPKPGMAIVQAMMEIADDLMLRAADNASKAKNVTLVDSSAEPQLPDMVRGVPPDGILEVRDAMKRIMSIEIGGLNSSVVDLFGGMIKPMIDTISGAGDFSRGTREKAGTTATEIAQRSENLANRLHKYRLAVNSFLERVGYATASTVLHFQEEMGDVSLSLGPPGAERQIVLSDQAVTGAIIDYTIELEPSPASQLDTGTQRQQLQEVIAFGLRPDVNQKLMAEGFGVRLVNVIKEWMRLGGLTEPDSVLINLSPDEVPNADPVQQARDENELMLLEGQDVQVLPHQRHDIHMREHIADLEKTPELPWIPPENIQRLLDHVSFHYEQLMFAQMMAGQGVATSGGQPGAPQAGPLLPGANPAAAGMGPSAGGGTARTVSDRMPQEQGAPPAEAPV